MTGIDVLLDLLQTFSARARHCLEEVPSDALYWQPDEEANSIALTAWHFSRALDILKVRVVENRPVDDEQWYTRGWAEKTGYDPRGLGALGFGNLGGYTMEQVKDVPLMSGDDLLAYFDQACQSLKECLQALEDSVLPQPTALQPPGVETPFTTYQWIRNFVTDFYGHLGEIYAIYNMWERQARADQ